MIDWDEVLDDADATPRSVLAEWLGRIDEIHSVVVVILCKEEDEEKFPAKVSYTASSQGDVISLGMLETAKALILSKLDTRE